MKLRHILLLLTVLVFLVSTRLNFALEVSFYIGAFLLSLTLVALWIATSYLFGYAKRNSFPVWGTFYVIVSFLSVAIPSILKIFHLELTLLSALPAMVLYASSVMQILNVLPDLGDWSIIWLFAVLLLPYAACFFSFRAGRRRFEAELEEKRSNWKPVEYH